MVPANSIRPSCRDVLLLKDQIGKTRCKVRVCRILCLALILYPHCHCPAWVQSTTHNNGVPRQNFRTKMMGGQSLEEKILQSKSEDDASMAGRDPLLRAASQLLPGRERDAIWAIYDWCRRADEVCDSDDPRRSQSERLSLLRAFGAEVQQLREPGFMPTSAIDLELQKTLRAWPSISDQPFMDMLSGMDTELQVDRFSKFDPDLRRYAYCVAGTVGLMVLPVLGVSSPSKEVSDRAIQLGVAIQLVNILRDVGDDSNRGRIYLPKEDLERFGVSEDDILQKRLTPAYQQLIHFQIGRTRAILVEARNGVQALPQQSQLVVLAIVQFMDAILDELKGRQCDNLSRKVRIGTLSKVSRLLAAVWDWICMRLAGQS